MFLKYLRIYLLHCAIGFLVAGEQLYIYLCPSVLNALAPKLQIFSYITKISINIKSQYVNKTLHVFLRTLPGNLQGPQTCACLVLFDVVCIYVLSDLLL